MKCFRTTRPQLGQALALGCGALLASCGGGPSGDGIGSAIFSEVRVIGGLGNGPGQFVKPRSIAVDRDDNVYVCDMTGRVQKFDPDGNYLLQWQMPETERGRPKGMALDHVGNIVVVEPHYSRINHFTTGGNLVSQWGTHGRERGELSIPRAVAFTPDGSAFVSEFQIVERLQKALPEMNILILAVFPRGADASNKQRQVNEGANAMISKLADGKKVHYLDIGDKFLEADGTLTRKIMPDLLHLSEEGYTIWAESIEPTLKKLMGE